MSNEAMLRQSADVEVVAIGGELTLWHPTTDVVLHLNQSAASVWQAFEEPATTHQVSVSISRDHGIQLAAIAGEVNATCQNLLDAGMLVGSLATPKLRSPQQETVHSTWSTRQRVRLAPVPAGLVPERGLPKVLDQPIEALGTTFSIEWEDSWVGDVLVGAFEGLKTGDADQPPEVVYRLHHLAQAEVALCRDGVFLDHVHDGRSLLMWLTRDLTKQAYVRSRDIVLHAAAVCRADGASVLVGQSGAGKSTLAASMVAFGGWDFLADEAVQISGKGTMSLRPFRRPIKLESGAAASLRSLGAPRLRPLLDDWSLVEALGVREDAVAVRRLVMVRYEPGAPPLLEPISQGDALGQLLTCCLAPENDFRARLHGLAALVGGVDTFGFTYGDPREASRTLSADS